MLTTITGRQANKTPNPSMCSKQIKTDSDMKKTITQKHCAWEMPLSKAIVEEITQRIRSLTAPPEHLDLII